MTNNSVTLLKINVLVYQDDNCVSEELEMKYEVCDLKKKHK